MNKIPPYNKICPKCKNPCAFEGFSNIQCPNQHCENFSENQEKFVTEWKQEQITIKPPKPEKEEEYDEELLEMEQSLRRLYPGFNFNTPSTSTTNNSQKDVSIDNFMIPNSIPQPDPLDYYDDDDYQPSSPIVYDDFDVY